MNSLIIVIIIKVKLESLYIDDNSSGVKAAPVAGEKISPKTL